MTPASSTRRKPRSRAAVIAERRRTINKELPGLLKLLEHDPELRRADLDNELFDLAEPLYRTPAPSTAQRAAGIYFDVDEVARFLRFCRMLRHIKGRTFARRRFVPDLWQIVYVLAPLFGWRKPDGARLYVSLFLEVPRKNGKSTLAAAIALYLLTADREPGAEVYSAARDRPQARAVFDVASKMAKAAPALKRRLKILEKTGVISYDATASKYEVLSSDRRGDSKHGLNIHGVVIDELHVIVDRELIGTLETGTGSREQPLIVYITTAGIPSESPVWSDKRDTVIKLATRQLDAPDTLGVIFAAKPGAELDGSWKTDAVIKSANPGYGRSLMPSYIAKMVAGAEATPADLNRFLRLHLGIPTEAVSDWLDLGTWDRSASIVDERELEGGRAFGGMDLASSLDLAAFILVFPDDADRYLDVVCRFWTPADTMARRQDRDRADYQTWARNGFLTPTPGETIDYDVIEADVLELGRRYDIRAVNIDPWGSLQLRTHLESAGVNIAELRQGYASLSPPMKETATIVTERRLRHGGNPVLRWCVSNVKAAQDPAGNIKPDRKRSSGRIDGAAGLIMAIDAWLRDISGGRSVYEDRGIEVIG